jgi:8-oxo-dGTP pyrophosphatase MutT (NUDIX family)
LLDGDEIRARIARAATHPAAMRSDHADALAAALRGETAPIAASVLVPLILGPAPGVLLTRRTAQLSSHAGQVSFPGGRIDPDDADAEAAALREATEEIGLRPEDVDVIGRLDDHLTATGYRITPVVGLIPRGLALQPNPEEVAALLELPMAVLLDPTAPQRREVEYFGRLRQFWVWPHPEHYIWGATAAILMQLAERLRGDAEPR